jgi:hypothetical protein
MVKLKNKGKVHPLTGYKGPEGEHKYCSTLSSSSVLDVGGWLMPCPVTLSLGKKCHTHCTEAR